MANDLRFPAGFLFGAATAAHQVEGGCTNNHWWEWEQERGHIRDGSTSEIACDHYRRFREDFALARELGQQAQRISIEWSRLEPEEGRFDERAADHYRAVCDSIREHGMEPMLTLHHFTNPIWAQRQGGWENPRMVDWLARYAAWAARALGERVRFWWTINEPMVAPALCYVMGMHPPCVRDLSRALPVARHALLAHGAMYHAVKNAVAHPTDVGPVLQMPFIEALDPTSEADRAAAGQQDFLFNQYYLDGLLRGVVAPPVGGGEEVPGLAGSCDVVGLNYYARMLVAADPSGAIAHPAGGAHPAPGAGAEYATPGAGGVSATAGARGERAAPGAAGAPATAGARGEHAPLLGRRRAHEPSAFTDQMGWEVYPPGLRAQLLRLKPLGKPLYVTENGMATRDEQARCRHLLVHLAEVHRAIAEGADVRGFMYWTLMDNFEWAEGYTRTFGLIEIDREHGLARRPREAAHLFSDVARAGAITGDMLDRYAVAPA